MTHALLRRLPALAAHYQPIPLATAPATIEAVDLGAGLPHVHLLRDDRLSHLYGGNKLRALEWILGDARRRGRRTLLSVGGIGSNQILALALHGVAHGFEVRAVLVEQPRTQLVLANLRAAGEAGARLRIAPGYFGVGLRLFDEWLRSTFVAGGRAPYWTPPGGASVAGMLGYVNAALEIAEQVAVGALPALTHIYCAAGSCATAVGLSVGCALAGIPAQVVGVRVAHRVATLRWRLRALERRLVRCLVVRGCWQAQPVLPPIVLHAHAGAGYGHATDEGAAARLRLTEAGGPELEDVYTAKAFAGALEFIAQHRAQAGSHLFIHTWGGRPRGFA